MPRMHPFFRLRSSVTLLGAIFLFTTWYVFCFERLVWFESLLFSLPQSSLLYTPFERAIHELKFDRILYVLHLYLSSVIILLYVLHLYLLSYIILLYVLHLYLFSYIILLYVLHLYLLSVIILLYVLHLYLSS